MATYFQGAVKSGSTPSEPLGATAVAASDFGYSTFAKSITLQAPAATTGAANVDATAYLPAGCQIVGFYVDSTVAWTASGTVGVTIGATAGGTEYVASLDGKTVTRGPTAAFTAAQLGAMAAPTAVSGSVPVVARAAVSAAAAGYVGTTIVTILYVPKS